LSINRYFVGFTTEEPALRLLRHNEDCYQEKYTLQGKPREMYMSISGALMMQVGKIGQHIKKMKSRSYIENLKKYPKMVESLPERHRKTQGC
jgi:putative endonuclease